MYSGLVAYNTDNIDPKAAFELSLKFFAYIKMPISGAGYYSLLKRGDHLGDHEIVDISLSDLKIKIKNNEVTAFRMYSERKGVQPWLASFGYMTKEFGGFNYIDAQYENSSGELDVANKILIALSDNPPCSYGIAYFSDKITNAFYYATGDNMVNIYAYESSSLFKRECLGRFEGRERYKKTMLRMVYPINVINQSHLEICVGGVELKQWISNNAKHGSLEELNNGLWLWVVSDNDLDYINECLGEAGVLLSWKPFTIKKSSKKLP